MPHAFSTPLQPAQLMSKRRQLSLGETLQPPELRFHLPVSVPVVDLFCSVGGFSAGAKLAGHVPALGVEANVDRCFVHRQNHPECAHLVANLPDADLSSLLPAPDTLWHLHASPPCQRLSMANGGNVRENDDQADRTQSGLSLVVWFLDLVQQRRPCTWSFEQVNHPKVIQLLKQRGIDHIVCKMEEWGLPQSRVRVLAGTSHLIRRFQGLCNPATLVSVADVLPLPVPGARIKGSTANYSATSKPAMQASRVVPKIRRCRSATKPSLTVIGIGHTLVWCDAHGDTVRQVSVRENATLQGFPDQYIFSSQTGLAQIEIGDAFPPMIARLLLEDYKLPKNVWPNLPPDAVFPPRALQKMPTSPSLDF